MTHRSAPPRCPTTVPDLWLVVVLLVGLLGMHGLASDHASMSSVDSGAVSAATAHDVGMDVRVLPLAAAQAAVTALAGTTEDHMPAMGGLCLAVLGAVLLLGAVRRALPASPGASALRASGLPTRGRALAPPRPPDLVAGLCVSRT